MKARTVEREGEGGDFKASGLESEVRENRLPERGRRVVFHDGSWETRSNGMVAKSGQPAGRGAVHANVPSCPGGPDSSVPEVVGGRAGGGIAAGLAWPQEAKGFSTAKK